MLVWALLKDSVLLGVFDAQAKAVAEAQSRLADLGLWEADVCFTLKGYDAATGCYARSSTTVLRPRSWYEREEVLPDDQAKKVAADVYHLIFLRLDAEPGLTGEEAGRVATAVERLVADLLGEPGGEVYRVTRYRVLAGNTVIGFAHAADEGAARSQLESLGQHLDAGPDLLALEPEGSFELAASGLGDASRATYGLPPRRTR